MKFSIDDLVVEKCSVGIYGFQVYKVVGFVKGFVMVEGYGVGDDCELGEQVYKDDYKPDEESKYFKTHYTRYKESKLITVPEAFLLKKEKVKKLNVLNAEFEKIIPDIKQNVNEATVAMSVVKDYMKEHNKRLCDLSEFKSICKPLYDVLTEAGWSHSSLKC